MSLGRIAAFLLASACALQPPPAVDPSTQAKAAEPEPEAEPVPIPAPAPPSKSEDTAKMDMMMADPTCVVEVVAVLKSARGLWSDPKKNTCTYEVVINKQRYKYTRMLPKDRKREPDEICDEGLDTTDEAVRDATHECKDLQGGQRPVTGLIPIR